MEDALGGGCSRWRMSFALGVCGARVGCGLGRHAQRVGEPAGGRGEAMAGQHSRTWHGPGSQSGVARQGAAERRCTSGEAEGEAPHPSLFGEKQEALRFCQVFICGGCIKQLTDSKPNMGPMEFQAKPEPMEIKLKGVTSDKNQKKDIDIRTRHWHWHWLCFSHFFHAWGGEPPKGGKKQKNKANANANAWFLYRCLFSGSCVRGSTKDTSYKNH